MVTNSELAVTATVSFLLGYALRTIPLIRLLKYRIARNPSERLKLAVIIRSDLKMSTGKIASQCCHATLACYKQGLTVCPDVIKRWESLGQPKVILRANHGAESLKELARKATKAGLLATIIRDAGRTQVLAGSETALGIGPECSSKIDKITGGLKLL